jgi:DNA-binding CsgD family transcriptional regulator
MVEKKKQNQPKHHASKSPAVAKLRRKKIIKAIYVDGKTEQQAGIEAGLNPKTANSQVSRILKEPQTQLTFKQLLDKVIPDERLSAKYDELLSSKKVISAMVIGSEGMKDAGSMTRDFVEVDDCAVQLKCADSISKLKGHLVEKHEMDVSGALMALVKNQLNNGKGSSNHTGQSKKS